MQSPHSNHSSPNRGKPNVFFIFIKVLVCILSAFIIAFCLFVYILFTTPRHEKYHKPNGAFNEKMIALGLLQYIQDYDERFPPTGRYIKLPQSNDIHAQSWGPDYTLPDGRVVPGIIFPYVKNREVFLDIDDSESKRRHRILEFMYNDLMATHSLADLPAPASTILVSDGDNRLENAGHALTLASGSYPAVFNKQGRCDAGKGGSVREARTRHNGGANFTFADGHTDWFKGGTGDKVFFPPRESSSPSSVDPVTKQQIGPIPGGAMDFHGRPYRGTFHIE